MQQQHRPLPRVRRPTRSGCASDCSCGGRGHHAQRGSGGRAEGRGRWRRRPGRVWDADPVLGAPRKLRCRRFAIGGGGGSGGGGGIEVRRWGDSQVSGGSGVPCAGGCRRVQRGEGSARASRRGGRICDAVAAVGCAGAASASRAAAGVARWPRLGGGPSCRSSADWARSRRGRGQGERRHAKEASEGRRGAALSARSEGVAGGRWSRVAARPPHPPVSAEDGGGAGRPCWRAVGRGARAAREARHAAGGGGERRARSLSRLLRATPPPPHRFCSRAGGCRSRRRRRSRRQRRRDRPNRTHGRVRRTISTVADRGAAVGRGALLQRRVPRRVRRPAAWRRAAPAAARLGRGEVR
mmetsp:Transcript_30079/g.94349  ORF Transcript_30079/g.94349 Transcript_30079/m.94349 type:complete len:354 (+) Transcript_30079:163-1224(+)